MRALQLDEVLIDQACARAVRRGTDRSGMCARAVRRGTDLDEACARALLDEVARAHIPHLDQYLV